MYPFSTRPKYQAMVFWKSGSSRLKWVPQQGLGKVFHSSCWLGDLSGLGDELEWSQRVSRVVSEGCGDADSSGQAMEADRGVA